MHQRMILPARHRVRIVVVSLGIIGQPHAISSWDFINPTSIWDCSSEMAASIPRGLNYDGR